MEGGAKAITSRRREIKSTHKNVLGNPLVLGVSGMGRGMDMVGEGGLESIQAAKLGRQGECKGV